MWCARTMHDDFVTCKFPLTISIKSCATPLRYVLEMMGVATRTQLNECACHAAVDTHRFRYHRLHFLVWLE